MEKLKNFSYEIIRNIFTIMIMGLVLYFLREYSTISSDYLILFILLLIGGLSYFILPKISKKISDAILKGQF